ncbi:MAG TPA: FeoA family protein [Anaerolineaceae bacterium]|nr:FeoA family protein [Anaerolineaceae bacterium]
MIKPEKPKVLLEVESGTTVRILKFMTGNELEGKLRQLGILPGNCAKVIRHAPLGGPFLIELNGREIALGQAIASKIEVEVVSCVSP